MNGIILMELGAYVEARLGAGAWQAMRHAQGLDNGDYYPVAEYPDQDALTLVNAAAQALGKPTSLVLRDFGEFLAPELIRMFGHLIPPTWRTLDLIENTERMIHEVLRRSTPAAKPPQLHCSRPDRDDVIITYRSARRMCMLAEGIALGIAGHYHEPTIVEQPRCMLRGDPYCEIRVRMVR